MNNNKNLQMRNKQLKADLEARKLELELIKGSKAYKATRLIGQAKKEFRKSPIGFTKKTVKKVVKGGFRQSITNVHRNLSSIDSLQNQYKQWIKLNEPDSIEIEGQKKISKSLKKRPLISIITPVFNPPVDVLEELIKSVINQSYDNFELALGNFGDDKGVSGLIEKYSKLDKRIKHLAFTENEGIAENSNKILNQISGEYIALLDHDDTLSPDALFENAKLINEEDYDFIYSDKDKIDESGNRFEPFFKPGWSPEIMLNANYLTHLNVMKTSIVNAVGGWDADTDGAQDWDLFLKVISKSKKIGHIPKVLYHWRVIATSTALSIETKPYALKGQRNAVDKYLAENGIPAISYHEGAELLLNWTSTKRKVTCVVVSHARSNLDGLINNFSNSTYERFQLIILHSYDIDRATKKDGRIKLVKYEKGAYLAALTKCIADNSDYILLYDDRLKFELDDKLLDGLLGWLDVRGVGFVGPRVVDRNGYAVDCGSVVTPVGVRQLFVNSPPYHQTPLGNIEWVRNMVLTSPVVFTVRAGTLKTAINTISSTTDLEDSQINHALQLEISKSLRGVFNPKVRIECGADIDFEEIYEETTDTLTKIEINNDPYMNPNLSSDDPMKLANIVSENHEDDETLDQSSYYYEATAHAHARMLTQEDINLNLKTIQSKNKTEIKNIKTALILLPDFFGIYAGLNNIFSYADGLRRRGVGITFAIMTSDQTFGRQKKLIKEKYPELEKASAVVAVNNETARTLPASDVAICTQWATAYLLALYNNTKRKCYFIQDREASFYPKGTISGLVECTYGFGFFGLANTHGLLDWYKSEYGGSGTVIKSKVDLAKYSPPEALKTHAKKPYKVFFYARPNEPRNAFELGAEALRILKRKYGKDVEIYAAGADWNPEVYGLEGVLVNLGKISYDKLPSFYRSMDAGVMFMFSGHPGVVASELMASGCPVVVNEFKDSTWYELYENRKTCLVSAPIATEVARNIEAALTDSGIREKIIPGGLSKVEDFYKEYEKSIDNAQVKLMKKL